MQTTQGENRGLHARRRARLTEKSVIKVYAPFLEKYNLMIRWFYFPDMRIAEIDWLNKYETKKLGELMIKGNRLGRSLLILTAAGIMAISASASATVVYNWQTISTSDALTSAAGRVEISDEAFRSGNFSLGLGAGSYSVSNSSIESIYFGINDASLSIEPNTESDGFEGELTVDFSANDNGTVDGSLYANDTETEVEMTTSGGVWQILHAGSDNPAIGDSCFFDHFTCIGTGQWRLDASTAPTTLKAGLPAADSVSVPEPTAGGLFGLALGLIGLALLGRRRQAAVARRF